VAGLAYTAGALSGQKEPGSPNEGAPAAAVTKETEEKLGSEVRVESEAESEVVEDEAEPIVDGVNAQGSAAEDEAPNSVDEALKDGSYYVRVASYKDKDDAAGYAATLSARSLVAHASADPAGSSWHLVRLGPFQSRGEAEKARFKLKVHERLKAYVLPRSNGKYHVQVGSFNTPEKAEPVAKRFAALGHATKVSRVKMGDQRWHCVRIGPFDTAEEAASYQELVKSESESVVIPYGPPKL
jgi:cell division protein FtsN